jgi:activator of 2-hydroxyglutaryl-CoA dehydratase
MKTTSYRLGIDIGSTTAKMVVLNPAGERVFSAYRRHNTETLTATRMLLDEAQQELGNLAVDLLLTGSAGWVCARNSTCLSFRK